MDHFAGLDVWVKETSVCIVDDSGKIVREVKVASEPEALLAVLKSRCESASNCDPRSKCRKSLTDKVFAGNWWGHNWTPIKSLKNDRFIHRTKYLASDWGGVQVGRRSTAASLVGQRRPQ